MDRLQQSRADGRRPQISRRHASARRDGDQPGRATRRRWPRRRRLQVRLPGVVGPAPDGHNRAAELHRLAPEVRDEPSRQHQRHRGSQRSQPPALQLQWQLEPRGRGPVPERALSGRQCQRHARQHPCLQSVIGLQRSARLQSARQHVGLGRLRQRPRLCQHQPDDRQLDLGNAERGDGRRPRQACRHHGNRLHHAGQHPISRRQRNGAGQIDPEHAGRCLQGWRQRDLSLRAVRPRLRCQ